MSSFYDCRQVVDIADEPHHHLVIANEYVRAFAVEIPPRTRTLCHHHPHEYLLYVAKGAEIISAARDEEPKRLNYVDGECELSKAGLVHVVENLGDGPFRNVVVELEPVAAELKRGERPGAIAGDMKIQSILEEGPGAIFSAELEPSAELEIAGPAVIAAPYEPVMIREIEEFDVPLDHFKKLMWVCAPRKVGVKNVAELPATVLVFAVGISSK
jgi:quercetin dioxygenase-like cupin family protein